MLIAGSLLLGFHICRHGLVINKKSWPLLGQAIIFHIYIAYVAEFWALQYVASAKTALIYNLSPFITALITFLLGYEILSRRKWIGLGFGFAALMPWLLSSTNSELFAGSVSFISVPELALLGAVTSACYGWILVSRLMKEFHYTPLMINGVTMLVGGALAFLSSLYIEGKPHITIPQTLGPWETVVVTALGQNYAYYLLGAGYLIALIIVANIICYNLYAYLLKRYSATFLSFSGFLCPLFAAVLGRIFFGEQLSSYFIITMFLAMCGLYYFYQDEGKRTDHSVTGDKSA